MKVTIEQKIIPAIVIAVSLILGALGTYTYLSSKERLLGHAQEEIDAMAKRLAASLVSPLWDLNDKSAEEFVVSEMTAQGVIAIVVRDAKGAVFAAKVRNAAGAVGGFDGMPFSDDFGKLTRTVVKDGEQIGSIELRSTDQFVRDELRVLLFSTLWQVVLIDLAIVAILLVLIRRVVTRPLGAVVDRLKEISEGDGDLTVSLPEEGAREISLLAHSFNVFVAKTRVVIDQVKDLNLEMVSAAEQLSATTREIAKSNDAVSHQSKALASAAEEMSVTVVQVERNSCTVQEVSAAAQKTASNGVQVISQSVKAIENISEVVQRAVVTVQGLGEEAKKIRMVVDVIEEIADQTNLLALNAAIEAARAGEHGRGFAVVADEVRTLAKNTVKATSEVSRTVASIQTESVKAVEVMKQGQQAVASVVGLAKQAGAAIHDIDSTVAIATSQTQQIVAATQDLAATIRDMSRNVEQIADAVEHNSLAALEIAKTADSVAKQADHLQGVTGTFKT
ncbi:MAG: methyl-accepting chemotaxis protein [Pseudomonadota bacterium]